MIRTLVVEGFKSFIGRQIVELRPLTMIYGPNSSGKSSLIQSLLLLKQTADALGPENFTARGALADLGSFQTLVSNHDLKRELILGIAFDRAARASRGRPQERDERGRAMVTLQFGFAWNSSTRGARQRSVVIGMDRESPITFNRQGLPPDMPEIEQAEEFVKLASGPAKKAWHDWTSAHEVRVPRSEWIQSSARFIRGLPPLTRRDSPWFYLRGLLPFPTGTLAHESEVVRTRRVGRSGSLSVQELTWDDAMRRLSWDLRDLLASIVYIGPIRRSPERFRMPLGPLERTVGREGEHYVGILARNRALTTDVNEWLGRLGVNYEVSVRTAGDVAIGELTTLVLTDKISKVKVSPSDVGFGISQLMPIVVQCLLGRGTIICVEQPEIHVHPRLQTELADLLLESVRRRRNQLIVETHSEHLMLRLQKLVRQGRISPDSIGVLYVDPDKTGGASVRSLRLGPDGEFLDLWPHGFFSERFDEIFGASARPK